LLMATGLNYYEVLTAIDKTEIVVDESLTATVSWKDLTGTHLLSGASVYVGAMGPWGPETGTPCMAVANITGLMCHLHAEQGESQTWKSIRRLFLLGVQ
jgi:hypothetical protein